MNKNTKHGTMSQTVIAGSTRNLPSVRESSSRLGDGVPLSRNDGSSAMTKKGGSYLPCVLLLGLLLALLTSCQTELKLAKKFVAERQGIQAAVYFPEKAEVTMEPAPKYGTTQVLNGFNQDLFLDVMYNAYAKEMENYGVEVYVPEDINQVPVDSTHWLVMLSRMEISGRITEYEDYLFSDTDEYTYKQPLNTVNVASWFEVNDGEWLPVLFCEHNLMDGFDSKTDYSFWTGNLDYNYTIDTLELKDVYNYAVYLGKMYAGYTYDYMMNRYVEEGLKNKGYSYQLLLRYDPYKKQLRYAEEDDYFIEVK